jgi:hypothetical protein
VFEKVAVITFSNTHIVLQFVSGLRYRPLGCIVIEQGCQSGQFAGIKQELDYEQKKAEHIDGSSGDEGNKYRIGKLQHRVSIGAPVAI